jgi:alpha-tubulin suppressor-like RCC1 family protein
MHEGEAHLSARLIERLRGEGIVEIAAGYGHVAAVSDAGDVWTWGTGLHAQLGHGDLENRSEPELVRVLQEKVIISVSVGHSHSVCVSDEDLPYTWGFTHGYAACMCT